MKPLPNLDFIRAVAVLTVVIEHTLLAYKVYYVKGWEVAWIGVAGVFVFFVHTALVLMWSMERKPHTLDFYVRRIFRIYPLALLAFAVAVLFHAPVDGLPDNFFLYAPPHGILQWIAGATLTGNLFTGYIPMAVMWSLPYEVQMYLVLPVMFFFVRRNFQIWPLLVFWCFIVAACRPFKEAHNFFLCIPYFLPGVIAYVGFGRWKPRLPAWLLPIVLFGAWEVFMFRPGWRRAGLFCLGIGLVLPLFHQFESRWIVRASHEIAKYSYGMYLAHPFAIVVAVYLMKGYPVPVQLAMLVSMVVVLPVCAYYLLEKPMIGLGSRLANLAEKRYEQHQLEQFRIPTGEIK